MLAFLSTPVQATLLHVLAVTHTITSAAIGAQVSSVPFAFSLAFLFHLFLDTLLHWNIYTDRHRWPYVWILVDVLGGLLLAYALIPERFFTAPVLAAVFGGNLPDLWHGGLDLLARIRKSLVKNRGAFFRFHEGLQNETTSVRKGLLWQGVLLVLAVWAIRG